MQSPSHPSFLLAQVSLLGCCEAEIKILSFTIWKLLKINQITVPQRASMVVSISSTGTAAQARWLTFFVASDCQWMTIYGQPQIGYHQKPTFLSSNRAVTTTLKMGLPHTTTRPIAQIPIFSRPRLKSIQTRTKGLGILTADSESSTTRIDLTLTYWLKPNIIPLSSRIQP